MTLTGSKAKPEYMGVYQRSEKTAHGAPVFVKTARARAGVGARGESHYLFRDADGRWRAANDEDKIDKGVSAVKSSSAAALPSEAGLKWTCTDDKAWRDEPAITCTAVR